MSSVTQRINKIKQPYGGYLSIKKFSKIDLHDKDSLYENENISPIIIGLVVDYMTRFILFQNVEDAFEISCRGALIAEKMAGKKKAMKIAYKYIKNIRGMDDKSIISACKLVFFDVWVRNPIFADNAKNADDINPDKETIYNIKVMVERSIKFFNEYGPVKKIGFTFEPNGYSKVVTTGDGDYLTEDVLWDFKVSKSNPKPKDTLQILMYWIMGRHSGQKIYKNINHIGFYNPRLNRVFIINVKDIPKRTIISIEEDVICY